MKAIAARNKNADKIDLGGWILVMFFLLCNAFMIIRGARNLIHSDGATAILFAREQWMQGKLHPDGWWYGTDIWNIGLNTLILPFFAFCKRWVDARAGAVILQTILMMFVMLWFKRIKILNNRVWFVILLMMLPASEVISEHWYFQATYMTLILFLAVMIILSFLMLEEKRKVAVASMVLLVGILVFRISMGYMMVLVFALPMMGTMLLLSIKEYHIHAKINNQIKRYALVIAAIAVGSAIGFAYNQYLTRHLNFIGDGTAGYLFMEYFAVNLNKLIQAVLRLYGAADQTASLLSLSGILKVFSFAYMVIMLFFIPILLLKNYHRLKSQMQRNFLIFSVLSSMAVVYLFIFTGMEQSRYLLWIYFYSLILFGIFMDNFQEINAEFKKEIKAILIAFFAMMFVVVYFYYISYDYKENPDVLGVNNETVFYKADYDLVEYMEKNNYTFGYAPYWTAYSNHVISDGKVKMTALELDFSGPYLWLTSEKWYKPDSHQGECFVLVGDDMIENVPPIYDAKAIRKDQYKQYTIYVFDSVGTLNDIWSTFAPTANQVIPAK